MEEEKELDLTSLLGEETIRYTYLFEDEITKESVNELIGILASVPSVDLYFSTIGGEMSAMDTLIHFINNHFDINIYLTNSICSAGTFILTDCTKPIYITESLFYMLFHMGDMDFGGKFRKRTIKEDILFEQLKELNNSYADKFKKLGLNAKEIKAFLNGEGVVLYRKDFKRLKLNKNNEQ